MLKEEIFKKWGKRKETNKKGDGGGRRQQGKDEWTQSITAGYKNATMKSITMYTNLKY